jgi:glycogen synthase
VSLRILHILDHSVPVHSGYSFRSLALLAEQRRMGWDTVQLTTPKQGSSTADEETVDGWVFHRTRRATGTRGLSGYVQQMMATRSRIEELTRRFRPDILHAHSPVLNAIPALPVARKFGLPFVYEMRASWEDAAVDHGTTTAGTLRYRLSRSAETWVLRRADAITTICEGLRQDIVARGGIPDAKVTVIPNAVDAGAYPYAKEPDAALRERLNLRDTTVLGFAGSFYGYEGLDLLIEAFALLSPRHPRLRLLLLGGGPQEDGLKRLVATLGLANTVIFAGRVPHDDVQRYYSLMQVLCYPRKPMRLTELVTPLKPLEAMAQGKIVVASDVGGHRELIRHQSTGILFRAGDVEALAAAIAGVLAGHEDWERMRTTARKFVETERTWRLSAMRYRGVYDSVGAPTGTAAIRSDER